MLNKLGLSLHLKPKLVKTPFFFLLPVTDDENAFPSFTASKAKENTRKRRFQ